MNESSELLESFCTGHACVRADSDSSDSGVDDSGADDSSGDEL